MWTLRSTKSNYGTAHADAPGQSRLDPEQYTECTSRHRAYGLRSQSRIPIFDSIHVLTPPEHANGPAYGQPAIRVLSNFTCIEPKRERPAEPDMLESDDD